MVFHSNCTALHSEQCSRVPASLYPCQRGESVFLMITDSIVVIDMLPWHLVHMWHGCDWTSLTHCLYLWGRWAFHGKVGGMKSIRREGETMWSASLVQAPQWTYRGADETLNRGLWDFWRKLRIRFNYSKHAVGWLYPGNPSWLALQVSVSIPLPENKCCCPQL